MFWVSFSKSSSHQVKTFNYQLISNDNSVLICHLYFVPWRHLLSVFAPQRARPGCFTEEPSTCWLINPTTGMQSLWPVRWWEPTCYPFTPGKSRNSSRSAYDGFVIGLVHRLIIINKVPLVNIFKTVFILVMVQYSNTLSAFYFDFEWE